MPIAKSGPGVTETTSPGSQALQPLAPPSVGPKRSRKLNMASVLVLVGSAIGGGLVAVVSMRAIDDGATLSNLANVPFPLLVSIPARRQLHDMHDALMLTVTQHLPGQAG
jgi:hypothetical protein